MEHIIVLRNQRSNDEFPFIIGQIGDVFKSNWVRPYIPLLFKPPTEGSVILSVEECRN